MIEKQKLNAAVSAPVSISRDAGSAGRAVNAQPLRPRSQDCTVCCSIKKTWVLKVVFDKTIRIYKLIRIYKPIYSNKIRVYKVTAISGLQRSVKA